MSLTLCRIIWKNAKRLIRTQKSSNQHVLINSTGVLVLPPSCTFPGRTSADLQKVCLDVLLFVYLTSTTHIWCFQSQFHVNFSINLTVKKKINVEILSSGGFVIVVVLTLRSDQQVASSNAFDNEDAAAIRCLAQNQNTKQSSSRIASATDLQVTLFRRQCWPVLQTLN